MFKLKKFKTKNKRFLLSGLIFVPLILLLLVLIFKYQSRFSPLESYPAAPSNAAQAISFNGSEGFVDTNYTANPSSYTIEAWIKFSGWGENGLGRIISKKQTTSSTSQEIYNLFLIGSGVNRLQFERTFTGGLGVWATPNNSLKIDNIFHHIAVTYNDTLTSKPSIYIDGVSQTVNTLRTTSGSRLTGTGYFLIGNRHNQDRTFKGIIDEVRIWNTIRSASDIQSSMNSEISPSSSGLVSYYRFDEGTGTTTKNEVNGTTSTIPSSITWTTGYVPLLSSAVSTSTSVSTPTSAQSISSTPSLKVGAVPMVSTQSVCQKKIPAQSTYDAYDQADPDINVSHFPNSYLATVAYKTKTATSGYYNKIYYTHLTESCLSAGNCYNGEAKSSTEVSEPVISSNWIAWTESYIVGGLVQHHDIHARFIASGLKCPIAVNSVNEMHPALLTPIGGWSDFITWSKYVSATVADIYGLDLGQAASVTTCPDPNSAWAVGSWGTNVRLASDLSSSNYAVWEDSRSGNYDIYYRSSVQAGGNITALTYAGNQRDPAISGTTIVWTDDRQSGNSEIYYHVINTAFNGGTNLSNSGANIHDTNPDIYGNWVVWERNNQTNSTYSIEAKNLTTGETKTIAASGYNMVRNPAIYQTHVVWEGPSPDNTNLDIYYDKLDCSGTVTPTSTPTPTPTHTPTPPPAGSNYMIYLPVIFNNAQ